MFLTLTSDRRFHLPDFKNCTQLRQLSLPAKPELVSLFERTGSQHESLRLSFDSFRGYRQVIDAIEQNCKKLTEVVLHDSTHLIESVGEERYVAFLSSYGNQLIRANIEGIEDPKHMFEVFTKCSNLKIDFDSVHGSEMEVWQRIRVFGPRIRHLIVDISACTGEEYRDAISRCTTLSDLCFVIHDEIPEQDVIDTTIISVLSSLSAPKLERLDLIEFRVTEESVGKIVAASSNLVSIGLELAEPVPNGTIFQTIVDSNPHLREVRIVEDQIEEVNEMRCLRWNCCESS